MVITLTTVVILVNVSLIVLAVLGYIIWNLTKKNLILEDAVIKRDNILIAMSDLIKDSEKKLKEVDTLGAFKSDDEVGFFFKTVMEIQQHLNDFKV